MPLTRWSGAEARRVVWSMVMDMSAPDGIDCKVMALNSGSSRVTATHGFPPGIGFLGGNAFRH